MVDTARSEREQVRVADERVRRLTSLSRIQHGTLLDENAPIAAVEPSEVGVFAAHLLSEADPSRHNKKRYVVNGPEDLTGKDVVKLVEGVIGAKIEEVEYRDLTMLQAFVASWPGSKNALSTVRYSVDAMWEGKASKATDSKEVLEIAPPQATAEQVLKAMLQG